MNNQPVEFTVLTYLSRVTPPGDVLRADGLFDAVHFLLVSFAVSRGRLLGVPQGGFQRPHPLCRGPQTLLQLGQLTAKVCVVPHQLPDTKGQRVNIGQRFTCTVVQERRRRRNNTGG